MASTKSSSLGRSNPNSRSSEFNDPMRRSFSGNPFAKPSLIANPRTFLPNTPANSPSDFPRRNSVGGREGAAVSFFRDLDDKENGKDQILKPSKARSPAASSKSAKNFMSPTISASSKVTVSPRKKVLVERNEPARTSVPSTTEAKSPVIRKVTFAEPLHCSDLKPEGGVEQKKFEALLLDEVPKEEMHVASSLSCEELSGEAVFDMNVHFNPKNDTESSFETVADEPDCVILDPSFKLSPTPPPPPPPTVSSTSTILAPLDADPLMPPYDPKTNYLSPRPQFLHYKPKPRIELCKERELEEGFISGSFSDTEVTEDTQSEGSQKESEDVSSDEVVEEEARISEPSPGRTSMVEETVGAKEVPKPRFFMRSKAIIALLLLLSVAFISISLTNSPVIDHTAFQDFYKVYESSEFSEFAKAHFHFDRFSEFAKANFDGLARNFHTWFTRSLSSISELISNVRGVHNLGHLQYCNLTVLHEYNAVDQGPIFGRGEKNIVETPEVYPLVLNAEESDAASDIDNDEDIGDISAEHYDSVYEEQVEQDMGVITVVENASDDAPESEEVLEGEPATVIDISAEHYDSVYEEQVEQDMGVITANENASDDTPESEEVLEGEPATVIDISAEHYDSVYEEQVEQDMGVITAVENTLDDGPESEEVLEGQPATVIESDQALQLAEVSEPSHSEVDMDLKDQRSAGAADIHSEMFKAGNLEAKQAQEDNANVNVDLKDLLSLDSGVPEIHAEAYGDDDMKLTKSGGESVSIDAAIEDNEQRLETIDLPPGMVLYLLLCGGIVLIAGAAFNWSTRKGKSRSTRITCSVEKPMFAKAFHANSLPTPIEEQNNLDKPSLRNGPTEIDMQSCPSEMSSIQNSSSYRQKVVKELNEVHSLEKKPKKRRESLASSSDYSMGSPSYGSFTTYEKIQIKNGHGDEDTITPVRRSSRIRSQATSPL